MIIGSAEPIAAEAREEAVVSATALICATLDRILEDLKRAAVAAGGQTNGGAG